MTIHRPAMRLLHRLQLAWLRLRRPITLGVRVIARDADGAVLLVRHSYVDGWHLPGGGVGKGETVPAAAVRELREETGLIAAGTPRILSLHARLRPWASDHVAVVAVAAWTGAPKADGIEIVEVAFFPIDALPADTTPATRRRLAELLSGGTPAENW